MGKIIEKIQGLSKWGTTIIASVIFLVAVIVYVVTTKNLVKPATSREAWEFLLSYTNEYIWALFCGLVAKIVPFAFMLVAIGSLINYFRYDYSIDYVKMGVINAVLFITTMIIQASLIRFWESIAIVALVISFLLYTLINAE